MTASATRRSCVATPFNDLTDPGLVDGLVATSETRGPTWTAAAIIGPSIARTGT